MKNRNKVIIFISFVTISVLIGNYRKSKIISLLSENTSETHAIYDKYIVVYNTGPISYFSYSIDGKKYDSNQYGKFIYLEKGDTILIKYSNSDPFVAEIIDPCYMNKHKGQNYCR